MLDLKRNRIATGNGEPERPVLICIISLSESLAETCRNCLEALRPAGYRLEQHRSAAIGAGFDIYLWDRTSIPAIPAAVSEHSSSAKIVLIGKTSPASLRREIPNEHCTFVRNPISADALRDALSWAITRVQIARVETSESPVRERDRDEILQELFEANRKVQEYEQERSSFEARVVHDVCVSLTAAQGYCGLLLAGQLGALNVEQAEVLTKMQRGLGKLWKSVEAIEGLGQPTQIGTRLKLGDANFEECLQEAIQEVVPVLEKKQIGLKLEIEPPSGRLWLDSQKIKQVLIGLLENSCKLSPRDSSITVRARSVATKDLSKGSVSVTEEKLSKGYLVQVIDSGANSGAENLENVLDQHASCGDPTDRSGSGLGLAICRVIVEAHRGNMWATSDGHGTTFSLRLPEADVVLESHISRIAV